MIYLLEENLQVSILTVIMSVVGLLMNYFLIFNNKTCSRSDLLWHVYYFLPQIDLNLESSEDFFKLQNTFI